MLILNFLFEVILSVIIFVNVLFSFNLMLFKDVPVKLALRSLWFLFMKEVN